jgi:signal transduction histidine kinase
VIFQTKNHNAHNEQSRTGHRIVAGVKGRTVVSRKTILLTLHPRYTVTVSEPAMSPSSLTRPEDLVAKMVHDLRQPLGNIETSVYLLNLVVAPDDERVHKQLDAIESQLQNAAQVLCDATAMLGRMRAQRLPEMESRERTNPVSVGVR